MLGTFIDFCITVSQTSSISKENNQYKQTGIQYISFKIYLYVS